MFCYIRTDIYAKRPDTLSVNPKTFEMTGSVGYILFFPLPKTTHDTYFIRVSSYRTRSVDLHYTSHSNAVFSSPPLCEVFDLFRVFGK